MDLHLFKLFPGVCVWEDENKFSILITLILWVRSVSSVVVVVVVDEHGDP